MNRTLRLDEAGLPITARHRFVDVPSKKQEKVKDPLDASSPFYKRVNPPRDVSTEGLQACNSLRLYLGHSTIQKGFMPEKKKPVTPKPKVVAKPKTLPRQPSLPVLTAVTPNKRAVEEQARNMQRKLQTKLAIPKKQPGLVRLCYRHPALLSDHLLPFLANFIKSKNPN
jgi:hypothetical protein